MKGFHFFYEEQKNNLDVLLFGNSHLKNGLNTDIINSRCKIKSRSLSLGGSNIYEVYYNIIEALKNPNTKTCYCRKLYVYFPSHKI